MTERATSAAVGRLPGQLLLDVPGLPEPTQASIRPAGRRRVPRAAASGPAGQVVPLKVWGVWDGEDLVGVYAEEQVARVDAAVLRRDAVQAGVRASVIDCLPVQVFTEAQHGKRPRPALG